MKGELGREFIPWSIINKGIHLYLSSLVTKAEQGVLNLAEIYSVMMKYYYTCTVTKEEDYLLPSTKMQDDWDEQNPFYRYQLAGVEFIENPKSF